MVGTAICSEYCNDKSLDRKYDYIMYNIYIPIAVCILYIDLMHVTLYCVLYNEC